MQLVIIQQYSFIVPCAELSASGDSESLSGTVLLTCALFLAPVPTLW